MALPGDVTTFTLSFGPYVDAEGVVTVGAATGKLFPVDPATGERINLTHIATGQVILPHSVNIHLTGETGTATVGPLPHTDNPGLSMVGFGYRVEWDIASSKPSPGNKTVAVPATKGATADFDLLEVSTVPGVLVPVVTGATGPAGTITSATASGLAAGATPTVTLGGTPSARTMAFGLPAGATGPAGTITSASASALAPGATPTVTLGGTPSARTVAFGIPGATADDASIAALIPGPGATASALRAALVPKWKPSTTYASGEFVLNPSGQIVSANTAFTSGATYSAENWTDLSPALTSEAGAVFPLKRYASLQAAIDACAAAGGGVVQLPAGGTPVGPALEMKSRVLLQGPPAEMSVWGYNSTPTVFHTAWLAPDTSTTGPVVNFADGVVNAGIRDLMIKGVATRDGIYFATGSTRAGSRLRNVYVNGAKVGIYGGGKELRFRDLIVLACASHGVQIVGQDVEWEGGVVGFNGGHGIVLEETSGPVRMAVIDTFANTGAGLVIDGSAHHISHLQANENKQQGVLFRTAQRTVISSLVATSNGLEFATSGVRYSDVHLAHPTASNLGCSIVGGTIYSPTSQTTKAKYAVESTQAVSSFTSLIGIEFAGTYANGASPSALLSPLYNFNTRGCHGVPDVLTPTAGMAVQFRQNGTDVDQIQWTNGSSVVYGGVRQAGALYQAVVNVSASATAGAPSLDAKNANIWNITLNANVTTSTITNPKVGQQLTISFIQDATGGRTYAWPTNCKFAGAAAPAPSATAFRRDSVTFLYDGTVWLETARAIAVG